ncbi:MAG: zinc ribbon domain-containing protein [Prevotella sp.]|uniref:zinc ribbon domain-containing protein n=1 Tax=Prevotella sp. TaxID=59823 RepID=UPI002A2756C0|nr:zinc ribbon domain-containing protein [Prevotella sp.]MDD7319112.1 zinc ribbon domain-containing protein [Prevotellaceae bacterium]MDY4019613.1 zinc ribbon domain-containing protein [Prevotella sp.]
MKKCPHCNNEIANEKAKFCKKCGQPLSVEQSGSNGSNGVMPPPIPQEEKDKGEVGSSTKKSQRTTLGNTTTGARNQGGNSNNKLIGGIPLIPSGKEISGNSNGTSHDMEYPQKEKKRKPFLIFILAGIAIAFIGFAVLKCGNADHKAENNTVAEDSTATEKHKKPNKPIALIWIKSLNVQTDYYVLEGENAPEYEVVEKEIDFSYDKKQTNASVSRSDTVNTKNNLDAIYQKITDKYGANVQFYYVAKENLQNEQVLKIKRNVESNNLGTFVYYDLDKNGNSVKEEKIYQFLRDMRDNNENMNKKNMKKERTNNMSRAVSTNKASKKMRGINS